MVTPPPGPRIFPLHNEARAPKTPKVADVTTRRDGIDKFFRSFNEDYGISLPYREEESPSKRSKSPGHEAMNHMSYMFFQDPEGLSNTLQQFRIQSPTLKGNDEKLNYLLDQLTLKVKILKQQGTPRSKGQWPPPAHSLPHGAQDELFAPPSPTLSVKHAPKATPDTVRYPELPPAIAGPSRNISNTPYTSFTTAHTSFDTAANTSFWSEAPQMGSQAPTSPATSLGSSFDGANDALDCTQTTEYGGFMSSMDEAQIAAVVSAAAADTSPLTSNAVSSFDRTTTDGQDNVARDLTSSFMDVKTSMGPPQPPLPPQTSQSYPSKVARVTELARDVQDEPPQLPRPQNDQSAKDSPGRKRAMLPEHHLVKRIPEDGLAEDNLLDSFRLLPFELRLEVLRAVRSGRLSSEELDRRWQSPRSIESLHKVIDEAIPGFEHGPASLDGYSICAKLRWTQSPANGRLFECELLPPRIELPNAFQRKFGSDRFLILDVDPLNKPPSCLRLSGQQEHVRNRFLDMLGAPQQFLGRTWIQFHAEQQKARKKGRDTEAAKSGVMRYIFVAMTGDGLVPLDLREVVGWALPFEENAKKPFCKAYARLDLSTSRTFQIPMEPDDFVFVKDSLATNEPEDDQFNDPDPMFDHREEYNEETVMNDGCSPALAWIMEQIGQELKSGYVPSVVQFRMAGSKGLIFLERCDPTDEKPKGPLIQITSSQSKLKLRARDLDPKLYDPHITSLYVVRTSKPLTPSCIYTDFMPILVDRHVPPEAIAGPALLDAQGMKDEFLDALQDRGRLLRWLHKERVVAEEHRDKGITLVADFPYARAEKAIRMLESGFEPTKFQPLSKLVLDLAKTIFERKMKYIQVRLPRSTMPFGIADPTGTLKPGEIHLAFSSPFRIEGTEWSINRLTGEVLVARNPAARSSDIQKIKAVFRPELAHILDVVVFPARGPRPLADKLSGGDYDGDTFWICWEQSLVKPFRNAPAPRAPPDPRTLGIEVDHRTLGEIVIDPSREENVRRFVRMCTAKRLSYPLLGTVTLTLGQLVYRDNSLASPKAKLLADLKDLLMDSDKNGYTFDDAAWEQLKRDHGIRGLRKPAYFKYKYADTDAEEDVSKDTRYEEPNTKNIIDNIYFRVFKKTFDSARKIAEEEVLAGAVMEDEDLTRMYTEAIGNAPLDSVLYKELVDLKTNFGGLSGLWKECMNKVSRARATQQSNESIKTWTTAVEDCRNFYLTVRPTNEASSTAVEWLRQCGNAATLWDLMKASALAKYCQNSAMSFHIAANELCLLKAYASGPTRTMIMEAYLAYGMKKRKREVEKPGETEVPGELNAIGDVQDGMFGVS
ncbi:hypothetical protein LTR37_006047 [Vermiconidia calcicola]|uniref:Uncharacterized protein n=1 Tax=Vermiconidia calcicola TaxID=1690605 RepID=A0ACC3NHR8_9PEZI|nr:hypothetical protein LTR37_006047 [Vermiconidia calcicola]